MGNVKKWIFILICLFYNTFAFAQFSFENNRYYYWSDAGGEWYFEFNNSEFVLYDFSLTEKNQVPLPGYEGDMTAVLVKGRYIIEHSNNFKYLIVDDHQYLIIDDGDKYCFLYELNDKHIAYYGVNQKYITSRKKVPVFITPEFDHFIQFSSALSGSSRDGIRYRPPFSRISYDSLWAFDISHEKNQWIAFKDFTNTDTIIIFNGMIYPKNMDYYKYNARAKNIVISYNGNKQVETLKDSPYPQIIKLKVPPGGERTIRIDINDYYEGTRFSDAVISFIGFIGVNF